VRIILIAVWFLAAGTPAVADVLIRASPGGDVVRYFALFSVVKESGERVIIDGPCLSACTLVLSIVPNNRICVTRRAILGFHAARELDDRTGRLSPATAATRAIQGTYPPAVQAWIARHGGLSHRLILLRGRELRAMLPLCG
jgi:hypothetical protein